MASSQGYERGLSNDLAVSSYTPDSRYNGLGRYKNQLCINVLSGAVPAGTVVNAGTAIDSAGRLCCTTSATGVSIYQGIGRRTDGAVLVTYSPPDATSRMVHTHLGSFLVNSSGAIHVGGAGSMAFNFASDGLLVSRTGAVTLTFTRASDQTYFDSTGTLQSATTDVAAFDYNPTTLAPLGLSMWEARTNSIRNNTMVGAVAGTPGTLPTNWAVSAAGGLTTNVIGTGTENGISYTDLQIVGTTSGTLYVLRFDAAIAALAGSTWVLTYYVKLVGGAYTNITATNVVIGMSAGTGQNNAAFTATSAALNAQRKTNTTTPSIDCNLDPRLSIQFTSGVAIDITLRIGMPQLELGAFATPVISTSGAAATRAAWACSTTDLSWFNATEGTFVARGIANGGTTNDESRLFSMSDGTASNLIDIGWIASFTRYGMTVVTGGVSQLTGTSEPTSTTQRGADKKSACAYKLNDVAATFAGVLYGPDTSATIPTVTTLYVGTGYNGATRPLNGWLSSLSYYPTRLPNATLQSLST